MSLAALVLMGTLGAVGCTRQPDVPDSSSQTIVQRVRAEIAKDDFAAAEAHLAAHRAASSGDGDVAPEWLEAHSWLARGHLAAGRLDLAEQYARDTHRMASAVLATRPMDQEPRLPIAYGAAVEVLAQVGAQRSARTESIILLEREMERHGETSIAKRLQKNINLLSLEGTAAPAIVASEHLGPTPPTMDDLEGKVVLLFFWAHWCPDCKRMAPILAELDEEYREEGLTIFAPTQRYGYVAGGRDASPDEEKQYIDQVRADSYPVLANLSVPVDERNHLRYGVSTTPTLVLVDRAGVVRLYHPGQMTLEEIRPRIEALLRGEATTS